MSYIYICILFLYNLIQNYPIHLLQKSCFSEYINEIMKINEYINPRYI